MKESLPLNPFKQALREGKTQIGLWCSLCSNLAAEVIAGAGFDWILLDTEHAPNDLSHVMGQLQAMTGGTAIAAVEGVDGLFIGPSDLSAALGHLGNPVHPEVRAAIEEAGRRIRKSGKAAGILAPVEADARHWLTKGFNVTAVGSDLNLLARTSEELAAKFK